MRNRISAIIILISIVLIVLATVKGIRIGKFEILSISQIKEKNSTLEEKINEADSLISTTYLENEQKLEETFKNYKTQKQKYEELSGITSEKNEEIYETKQYDISYLWRVLGKYASNRKLSMGIDVQKSDNNENLYNFNFTVSGGYTNISQFITDIENDSDLYFRIYNFYMAGNGEIITATFTVKNINIDPSTIS